MKKTYEGLEMEVIRFSTEDIITTSEAVPTPPANTENTETTTSTNDDYTQWGTGTVQWSPDASSSALIYVKIVDGTEQYFVKQGDTYVGVHQDGDVWVHNS